MLFGQAAIEDGDLGLRRQRLLARQTAADRYLARAVHRPHAAQLGHRTDDAHEHEFGKPFDMVMLAFDGHEPQVACREAKVAVNLDAHFLGVLHESLLNEQAAFIRQQMDADLEEAILGAAVVGNAFTGRECGELLDVREVQRFIGPFFDLMSPFV